MRKVQKAAVAAAIIASFGFIATGPSTAYAAVSKGGGCESQDLDVDILGEVGIANGLAGNLLNGEGNPGAQITHVGSECGYGH